MRFARWYPLADAEHHAPREPGIFQVRLASGPTTYPTGKSAMIHYAAAADVRAAATAFAAEHPRRDWLCRHSIELAGDPQAQCERLVRRFASQFGCPPRAP